MRARSTRISTVCTRAVLVLVLASGGALWAGTDGIVEESVSRLEKAAGGGATVRIDEATGAATFIRLEPGAFTSELERGASLDLQMRDFLDQYGSAFGLSDVNAELVLAGERTDNYGLGHVRYRQVYSGLTVFGAEIKGLFDRDGHLTAVNGSTFRIDDLDPTPAWEQSSVEAIARAEVRATKLDQINSGGSESAARVQLTAVQTDLLVYRTGLVQGVPGHNHLAYKVEVVNPSRSIREFVFVSAQTGKVLDQFSGIHEALDRKVSEADIATVVWEDSEGDPDPITAGWEGGTAQQVTDWQNEIDGARETYNVFASMTEGTYLSYDSVDATMRTVNNDPGINCPNANWNGISTNYCSGVTGDDTVAHEWGHAYTEYTNGMVYAWQTGALNESYSDIWGEVVDFLNGRGTDSPISLRTDGGCSVYGQGTDDDDSYRWLSGEDDPAFGGAIRDMWNPVCFGDPGKVSDDEYWCTAGDNGGVHFNSGIPNHAFALIVDGGTYNGQTITGIGLVKAAHIHWNAQNMLTQTSDFADHADAIEASCTALLGVNLPDISTSTTAPGLSGEMITAADCTQLTNTVTAVEFRTPPTQCGFEPLLENDPPELCSGVGEVDSISLTDWESGIGTWMVGTRDVANENTFDTPDWAVVGDLPDDRAGMAAFVANLIDIGDCGDDDESGVLYLESPVISIPEGTLVPRVAVNHWVATEAGWDGGNVKISVNGGDFALVPIENFEVSPYNDTLEEFNTNPMANEDAFTGADGGTTKGSWGASHINLLGLAEAEDDIKLRFEFGIDGCNGLIGWYVDEVEVYSCSAEALPICGDSFLDLGELCDDGNMVDGDGCSSTCQIEGGWECSLPILPNPAGTNVVADESFEGGVPNVDWTATSTFGGIQEFPLCGPGNGCPAASLARTGDWLVWIGGLPSGVTSSVEQSVMIPVEATEIKLQTLRGICDDPSDELQINIDGNSIGTVVCDGTDTGWVEQTFSVAPYNDGGAHTLYIGGTVGGTNGVQSNIFVEDVSLLDNIPVPAMPSECSIVTLCGNGLLDDGEQCDDGNMLDEDGCSSTCQVETGWLCTEPSTAGVIPDNSFEAGIGGGFWTEFSSNFGTPLCDAGCGGPAAHDGDWYVWFGGIQALEVGTMSQSVTIPEGNSTLQFNLLIGICDSELDFIELLIDDNQEWVADGTSELCGGDAQDHFVDISAYDDGNAHTIEFHAQSGVDGDNSGFSNFFLDQIELPGVVSQCTFAPDLFADGFESGDTTGWFKAVPAP